MNDLHDLELLLRSRIPLIIIETRDEKRVCRLFASLAVTLAMPAMAWSATTGLQRIDLESVPQRHASEPAQALGQIKATGTSSLYLLMDFHPYLDDAYNIRLLKEIALDYHKLGHTLVLVSHELEIPAELEVYSARFSLSLPGKERLAEIIREEAALWSNANQGTLNLITSQLRGLTAADARRIIRNVIYDDGMINSDQKSGTDHGFWEVFSWCRSKTVVCPRLFHHLSTALIK